MENYEKGFVQEKKPVDKDIIAINEFFMKTLEKLDGISIAADLKAARQYRKTMVKVSYFVNSDKSVFFRTSKLKWTALTLCDQD